MLSSTLRTSHAYNHGEINKSASYDLVRKSTLKLDMCQVEWDENLQESETENFPCFNCTLCLERGTGRTRWFACRRPMGRKWYFMFYDALTTSGTRATFDVVSKEPEKKKKFNNQKHL